MGASVAQGFGTIGQQIAVRRASLASSRRATIFQSLLRTRTRRTKRSLNGMADHDMSFGLHPVVVPESSTFSSAGNGRQLGLADRRVYSETAERYWILRSEDEELRFTYKSAAQRN